MEQTVKISGMTCAGCAYKVQHLLSGIEGVQSVEVNLEQQEALLKTTKALSTESLSAALAGTKYSIAQQTKAVEPKETFSLKTYLPVILIFTYITGITLLIQFVQGHFNLMQWMNHFMAGFFLVFSFFKLLNVSAFADSYKNYDIVAKAIPAYGYIYPFIELGLGVIFLVPSLTMPANYITLVVMSVSIVGVLQSVLNKKKIQCACLGAVFNLPMSTITIIEDAIMIAMSVASILLANIAR